MSQNGSWLKRIKKLHRTVDTDAVSAESEISVYKVFKFHVIEKTSECQLDTTQF